MFLPNCWLFLVLSACFAHANIIEKNSESYGPYTVDWEQYNTCRGPKLMNLTTYTTSIDKDTKGFYNGAVNITFLNNTKLDEVKMSVYTVNGNRKTLLWNYIINKPCKHYAMRKVFETYMTVENCVVRKGSYFINIDYTESLRDYLGTSFFYGKFLFKVLSVSKKGNIICLVFMPVFKKI